jgi:hypothetical protein
MDAGAETVMIAVFLEWGTLCQLVRDLDLYNFIRGLPGFPLGATKIILCAVFAQDSFTSVEGYKVVISQFSCASADTAMTKRFYAMVGIVLSTAKS